MRILIWLSIGFAVSCALGVWLLGTAVLTVGAAAVVCLGVVLILHKRVKRWKPMTAMLFGLAFGSIWFASFDASMLLPLRQIEGMTRKLDITLTDYSFETDYGTAGDGSIQLNDQTYMVRFYLDEKVQLEPGDRVSGEFSLRYTAPGGKENTTSHSGSGMFLLAYPESEMTILNAERIPWQYIPAYVSHQVRKLLDQLLPADAAAFMKALLIGDTSDLPYGVLTDLSVSGIRHVAAVSGLHVSILMTAVYLLLGRNRYVSLLVGVPLLVFFAAMAGFSPSVIRACVMQALMLISLVVNREYDPPTALSFSVLAMLVANPVVITSVGFQLSVSSVAGIFLFCDRISGWLLDEKRLGKYQKKKGLYRFLTGFSMSVSVSLGAMVLTVPLTAWYFGMISLLNVVTNLLCLWLITFVFCGGLLVCAVGAVWMQAGTVLGWLLAWPVRYILAVAHGIADMPFAAVYTQSPYIVLWLVFCYGLLAVFLRSRKKRPGLLFSCAVLGLCLAMGISWTEPRLDDYRMSVLDVGQGQCILLQSGGKSYLVDCGGDRAEDAADTAIQTLLSQGITTLDGLILTHYDADHAAGTKLLLERIPARVLVLPAADERQAGAQLAEQTGCQTVWVKDETKIQWDDGVIKVFAGESSANSNESGSCVLFHTEKCDILITGDRQISGELALLRAFEIPKLDVLVVGHHGSQDATSYALLRNTQPDLAVISVGEDNRYGMPAQAVLDKLARYGCRVRRTDLEGTILIRG